MITVGERQVRSVVPEARHQRAARDLVHAARRGSDDFAKRLADVPTGDAVRVLYALARLATLDAPLPAPPPRGGKRLGRPPIPDTRPWTYDEAKEAHRRWSNGERTSYALEGNRVYKRLRKAVNRQAGATS